MNHGILIQLYHPLFARFLHVITNNTVEIDLKPKDYTTMHSHFQSSMLLYKDKASHLEATKILFDKAICHSIMSLELPGMRTNSACQVFSGNLYALVALKEDRNEIRTGSCNLSHQCGLDFRLYYAKDNIYTFLIAVYYLTMIIDEADLELLLLPDFPDHSHRSLDMYPQSGLCWPCGHPEVDWLHLDWRSTIQWQQNQVGHTYYGSTWQRVK